MAETAIFQGGPDPAEGPLRVLALEDDPDTARFVGHVLRAAGMDVRLVGTVAEALKLAETGGFDLALCDVELPDGDGVDFAGRLNVLPAPIPVVLTSAHGTIDRLTTALRNGVSEFLPKPVRRADLVAAVSRVGRDARARAAEASRTVLAVGAHPDDVEIGVGGALMAHRAAGDRVYIVTMSRGRRGGDASARALESADAARLLDARLMLHDLEDTHISEGNPTIDLIEQAVRAAAPDVVYTHSLHDAHQDHRAVHRASMVATRRIATVGCYQSPSATVDYRPNHFIDIAAHVEDKLRLIACYRSQTAVRDYLEDDTVRAVARYWSRYSDAAHAEPIEIIRQQAAVGATAPARPAGIPAWTEPVDA